MHAEAARHLPKRFVFWAVDTLRAVPWIGPAPIAWLEDRVFALRDDVRQLAFKLRGADDADTLADRSSPAGGEPLKPPPACSIRRRRRWTPRTGPRRDRDHLEEPPAGRRRVGRPEAPLDEAARPRRPGGSPAFFRTFVRPDPERPYSTVLLVAMDMRQLDLDMEAGVEDPKPLTGPHGAGRIPRDPRVFQRVVAAFNGAFKTEHGNYGMMVNKRVLLPPQPRPRRVVVLDDGRVGFGTWGDHERRRPPRRRRRRIVSFRQNLDPLVDHGEVNPTGRSLWGFTLPGTARRPSAPASASRRRATSSTPGATT